MQWVSLCLKHEENQNKLDGLGSAVRVGQQFQHVVIDIRLFISVDMQHSVPLKCFCTCHQLVKRDYRPVANDTGATEFQIIHTPNTKANFGLASKLNLFSPKRQADTSVMLNSISPDILTNIAVKEHKIALT